MKGANLIATAAAAALLAGSALAGVASFTAAQKQAAAKSVTVARSEFDKLLLDYPSARFREVRALAPPKGGEVMLCGFVNSKNRMGAYTGWKKFLYFDVAPDNRLSVEETGEEPIVINAICSSGNSVEDTKDYSADLTFKP